MHHKSSSLGLSSLFAEGKASLQERSNRRWQPSLRGEPRAENQEAKFFFYPTAPLLIKTQRPELLPPEEPQVRARFGKAARDPRCLAAPMDQSSLSPAHQCTGTARCSGKPV